jgi:hypothetical protein
MQPSSTHCRSVLPRRTSPGASAILLSTFGEAPSDLRRCSSGTKSKAALPDARIETSSLLESRQAHYSNRDKPVTRIETSTLLKSRQARYSNRDRLKRSFSPLPIALLPPLWYPVFSSCIAPLLSGTTQGSTTSGTHHPTHAPTPSPDPQPARPNPD